MKSQEIMICVDSVELNKERRFCLKEKCFECDGKDVDCNFYYFQTGENYRT